MIGRQIRINFFIASNSNSIYSNHDMSILFEEAIKLPVQERRKLADDIYESIEDAEEEF